MLKSNEKDHKSNLPPLDYSNLPKDIEGAVSSQPYQIEAEGKLTFDGRQFLIRVPKEMAEEAKISENTRVKFSLTKPIPKEKRELSPKDVKIELI